MVEVLFNFVEKCCRCEYWGCMCMLVILVTNKHKGLVHWVLCNWWLQEEEVRGLMLEELKGNLSVDKSYVWSNNQVSWSIVWWCDKEWDVCSFVSNKCRSRLKLLLFSRVKHDKKRYSYILSCRISKTAIIFVCVRERTSFFKVSKYKRICIMHVKLHNKYHKSKIMCVWFPAI